MWGSTRVGQRQKREEKEERGPEPLPGFLSGKEWHSGVGTLRKLRLGLDSLNNFAGLWGYSGGP